MVSHLFPPSKEHVAEGPGKEDYISPGCLKGEETGQGDSVLSDSALLVLTIAFWPGYSSADRSRPVAPLLPVPVEGQWQVGAGSPRVRMCSTG